MAQEFQDALRKCNNSSTPGPNHVLWKYLKGILTHDKCMTKILNIADTCFNLGYWSFHFKQFISIIIPKPNKSQYNTSKAFCPIVLLNTLSKLIEKVISHHVPNCSINSPPSKPARGNYPKVYNWCRPLPHTYNPRWMDQTPQNEYCCFWYCPVLPIPKPQDLDQYH